jgi:hypothetical protein
MACFLYYRYIFHKDCLLRGVCVLLGAIVTDYTEENISIRFVDMVSHVIQCCVTIFYGSGSDFWQITVRVSAQSLNHKKHSFQKNSGKNVRLVTYR